MPNKLEQMTGGKNFSYYWVLIVFVANILCVFSIQGWLVYTAPDNRIWREIWNFTQLQLVLFFIWYFPTIATFFFSYIKSDPIPQVLSTTAVTVSYLWIIWVVFTDKSSTAIIGILFVPGLGLIAGIIGYCLGVLFEKYRAKLKQVPHGNRCSKTT